METEKILPTLVKITERARKLSEIVNTPEGIQSLKKVSHICRNLAEGTIPKPELESSEGNPLAEKRNELTMESYHAKVNDRADELMRGEPATNLEQDLYLKLMGVDTATTKDPDTLTMRVRMLQEFDRKRKDIWLASSYRDNADLFKSEIFDSQIATPRSLGFEGVSRKNAIETFEKGWKSVNQDVI